MDNVSFLEYVYEQLCVTSHFISPLNIYTHRKCEVLGSKCRFVKISIYCPGLQMFISQLLFDQFSLKKKFKYI